MYILRPGGIESAMTDATSYGRNINPTYAVQMYLELLRPPLQALHSRAMAPHDYLFFRCLHSCRYSIS